MTHCACHRPFSWALAAWKSSSFLYLIRSTSFWGNEVLNKFEKTNFLLYFVTLANHVQKDLEEFEHLILILLADFGLFADGNTWDFDSIGSLQLFLELNQMGEPLDNSTYQTLYLHCLELLSMSITKWGVSSSRLWAPMNLGLRVLPSSSFTMSMRVMTECFLKSIFFFGG